MQLIMERYPYLLPELNNVESESLVLENLQSKNDLPILKVHQKAEYFYFHSLYDPVKEAMRWVEKFDQTKPGYILLLGIGFGYQLREFLKKDYLKKMICYEPSREIFKEMLQMVDLEELLGQAEVLILVGNEDQVNVQLLWQFIGVNLRDLQVEKLDSYRNFLVERTKDFQKKFQEDANYAVLKYH